MGQFKQGVDPEARYARHKDREWFLCDRCGFAWPESKRVVQDGFDLCRDNCAYREGKTDRDIRDAKGWADAARREASTRPPKRPFAPEMRGIPGVTDVTPDEVTLIRGGASQVVTIAGVNLTVTGALYPGVTYGGLVENAVPPVYGAVAVDGTQTGTLTVRAPVASTPGDYDLYFNGDRFKNVFRVRL